MNAKAANPDQKPTHILWVELTTRISTQPLHYRSGEEETAASSIYQLYGTTRELMKQYSDASLFNSLSLDLFNKTLRPYTARRHRWMTTSKKIKKYQYLKTNRHAGCSEPHSAIYNKTSRFIWSRSRRFLPTATKFRKKSKNPLSSLMLLTHPKRDSEAV